MKVLAISFSAALAVLPAMSGMTWARSDEPQDVRLPPPDLASSIALLRAAADAAGNPQREYESLLSSTAEEPSDSLNRALRNSGARIGKTPNQVDDDLWTTLSAGAKPFNDFTLMKHNDNTPLKLSSLQGKVVLVNFWFPTCGPCLAEFPYIQKAFDDYRDRGFEILAINVLPREDNRVLQTVRDKKVTFTTLKMSDAEFAHRYGVFAVPANFLLDREGRLIYRPKIHDSESARTFEFEVEALLKHTSKKAAIGAKN